MFKRIWITGNKISENHKNISITQVYGRIYDTIGNIVVVSKDLKKRQLPGGKPKIGESSEDTLIREILEETGINIVLNQSDGLFGYYLVTENGNQYLQLRYLVNVGDIIEENLHPNETDEGENIIAVQKISLVELNNKISRLNGSEELQTFLDKI